MNGFYFNPKIDTINIRRPSLIQLITFLQNNDCALLSTVEKIAFPSFLWHCFKSCAEKLVKLLYLMEVRKITVVTLDWCNEDRAACDCKIDSFVEFDELTDEMTRTLRQKEERSDRWAWETDMRRSWEKLGEKPYPVVWDVGICEFSKYWAQDAISKGDIEHLRASKAKEETDSDECLERSSDGDHNSEVGDEDGLEEDSEEDSAGGGDNGSRQSSVGDNDSERSEDENEDDW
jgi:hypothetical protein